MRFAQTEKASPSEHPSTAVPATRSVPARNASGATPPSKAARTMTGSPQAMRPRTGTKRRTELPATAIDRTGRSDQSDRPDRKRWLPQLSAPTGPNPKFATPKRASEGTGCASGACLGQRPLLLS